MTYDAAVTILHDDALAALKLVPNDSLDAMVTDPPAGIAFMSKGWDDHGGRDGFVASLTPIFAEVLRVLKPGAHGVVWALPRTSGWTQRSLEDAGFEVRDVGTHLFGQGFPKSLDVSKAIDKRKDWTALPRLQGKIKDARVALGISQTEAARRIGKIGPTETLGGGGFMWYETGLRIPTLPEYARLKSALRLDDECDSVFEAAEREVIGAHPEGTAPGGFGDHRFSYTTRDITTAATDAAKQWSGWGTALKPAAEFWILVRKPLAERNVASNVLTHGTGALNIDAGRIGTATVATIQPKAEREGKVYGDFAGGETTLHAGRWPANVTLAHSAFCEIVGVREVKTDTHYGGANLTKREDGYGFDPTASDDAHGVLTATGREVVEVWDCLPGCAVRMLDEQSGESSSAGGRIGKLDASGDSTYGKGWDTASKGDPGYGDRGGASRFFYVAKPSTSEKNRGITAANVRESARAEPIGQLRNSRPEGYYTTEARNPHPTVKPVALMRWLVRLVTPPGGTVLDPFGGSGTTAVAAIHEQHPCVIIEREAEYVEVLRARVDRARLGPEPDEPAPLLPSEDAPPTLFDLGAFA